MRKKVMNRYQARDICNWSLDELRELEPGKILLEFDDGVIETTGRRTMFVWYIWEMHRQYPKTPMKKSHHYGMALTSGDTHSHVMNAVYWDLYDAYEAKGPMEEVLRLAFCITNTIYNDFNEFCDRYPVSIDSFDIIGLMAYPPMMKIVNGIQRTQRSIDAAYDAFARMVREDKNLRSNKIVAATRAGLLSMKQVQQCFVCRGYATEIHGELYPTPIIHGLARGIRSLSESMKEARTATKSLLYNKYYLSDCEYFSRKLQLGAGVVAHLYHGDCGSTYTWDWPLDAREFGTMQGMHYLDDTGAVKTITRESKDLIGKTLRLRVPFGCTHKDRQTVCSVCMGSIADSIPAGTSPGHIAAISLGEKITQITLSTKHVDGNANVDEIQLDEFQQAYLAPGAETNTLRLASTLNGKSVKIIISAEEARGIPSIQQHRDFEGVNIQDLSELSSVTFVVEDAADSESPADIAQVSCSMGSCLASMTVDLLYYIKENSSHVLSVSSNGDYIVDLCDWDQGLTMFALPLKHTSMIDYMKSVSSHILSGDNSAKSTTVTLSSRKFKGEPVQAVKSLLLLINSKIQINASHIFLLAYAMSAVDARARNYTLPRGGESFTFVKYEDAMTFRSIGTKLVYQDQAKVLSRPESYTVTDSRPAGLLDEMILG
jgi:hypothetical protein